MHPKAVYLALHGYTPYLNTQNTPVLKSSTGGVDTFAGVIHRYMMFDGGLDSPFRIAWMPIEWEDVEGGSLDELYTAVKEDWHAPKP